MAKTKISEFDSVPANNTDIDSINIAEGCAPSGINNAIRELMSQFKDQQTGASGDNFTVGGNLAVTGTTTFTGIPSGPTASAGTNTTQLATTAFTLANSVPTGVINMWGTGTAPTGWLLCTGGAVNRTTYAALFAVISTTFGIGDGSTTFNLPNYTNRMPYGATLGTTGGSADAITVSHTHTASFTGTALGTHDHYVGSNDSTAGFGGDAGNREFVQNYNAGNGPATYTNPISAGTPAGSVAVTSTGSSGTGANLQPYVVVYMWNRTA
jgi:microcystin-dependent protein